MLNINIFTTSFILLTLALMPTGKANVKPVLRLSLPQKCRTEGKITLVHETNGAVFNHHLSFSEWIDVDKSKVKIGYIAYDQNEYHSIINQGTLTVGKDGHCGLMVTNAHTFVPELAWFVDSLLPGLDTKDIMKYAPHFIGPSGFASLVFQLAGPNMQAKFSGQVLHRNVPCSVYYKHIELGKDHMVNLVVQILIPANDVHFQGLKDSYFTIRAALIKKGQDSPHGDVLLDTDIFDKNAFIIDYFNIESFDDDPVKYQQFKDEFNIPLGVGCSKFLNSTHVNNAKTFSMEYAQQSSRTTVMLAYDNAKRLLRRAILDGQINVWDLKENLLYHIEPDDQVIKYANYIGGKTCSIMNVFDTHLKPFLKPTKNLDAPFNIMEAIGLAAHTSFMGTGYVRDMPCRIYESVVPDIPEIFRLAGEPEEYMRSASEGQLTVVVYILEGMIKTDDAYTNFWPIKIDLLIQHSIGGKVDLLDSIDVYNFQWSLQGWRKKTSELFMVSDCYDDEDQQIRLELDLRFPRIHDGVAKSKDRQLIQLNKFKLENDMIEDVLDKLGVSKVHLSEFLLKLRPHHVNLNMLLGDQQHSSSVIYLGLGYLPTPEAYAKNRLDLLIENEESCVSSSAKSSEVSLALYCPASTTRRAHCIIVLNENDPSIKKATEANMDDLENPPCHVYRLLRIAIGSLAIPQTIKRQNEVTNRSFHFAALPFESNGSTTNIEGQFEEFEIFYNTQVQKINNYKFVLMADEWQDTRRFGQVRAFDLFEHSSKGDCSKLCNLDASCRSYSFCTDATHHQCILSNLDLKESAVANQLVKTPPSSSSGPIQPEQMVGVNGINGELYDLEASRNCDIHERDYLSAFRESDELIAVDKTILKQLTRGMTPFECAKKSAYLEAKSIDHYIGMFTFCPAAKSTCILDESLLSPNTTNEADQLETDDHNNSSDSQEEETTSCRVYRRKFQTYFNVTTRVFKSDPEQQVHLSLISVEECARACWVKLGSICASFDFCNDGSCLINRFKSDEAGAEFENRIGCLHYDRDFRLDELRMKYQIGGHQLFESSFSSMSFGRFLWNVLTCMLVIGAFAYGLVLGDHFNANYFSGLSSSTRYAGASAGSGLVNRGENSLYEGVSAIRMENLDNPSKLESD